MADQALEIIKLARADKRYSPQAYFFVLEALHYAQQVLKLGRAAKSESGGERTVKKKTVKERHLTGQELCQAIRQLAVEQFGLMAKTVFHQWGLRRTSDFGEIVFTMIEAGQMSKTPSDRREDFADHYDFDDLACEFHITMPAE